LPLKRELHLVDTQKFLHQFLPERRFLIGVSGGRDSIALLHILHSLGYAKLIVCHLNHQLRGRASAADARFVERTARALGLDCEIGMTDISALANQSKLSIETAGRTARYAFFVSVARRQRCRTVFLAHHADDLVETALLNLFRGASPSGVGALRSVSAHWIGRTQLTIVRPLLHVWRRQINDYVRTQHLKFREDASNAQLNRTRNRIRHRILPYIEKQLGRDVRPTIWRTARIWTEENELLESLLESNKLIAPEIEIGALRELPLALQRRAIFRWLRARNLTEIGFEVTESVRGLTEPQAEVAKVNLPGGRYVRRRSGKLFIQ
jgi:tRNA(Ile)-lysidine synthase